MVLSCFVEISGSEDDEDDVNLSSTFVVFDAITVVVFSYVNAFCFVVGASVVDS